MVVLLYTICYCWKQKRSARQSAVNFFNSGKIMKRNGITAGGNFIIDHVKIIDLWPEEGMLSVILKEQRANGGCPYNVLKDIALLKQGIPLVAVGIVGDDDDGSYILSDLAVHGIDVSLMQRTDKTVTSYTDVMTVKDTGARTFFHNKGANMFLDIKHFDFTRITAKILHVGYILLLDSLDKEDDIYGTRMARLLKTAQDSGLKTAVDIVSESGSRFKRIVTPALKYTDYLIINEIEAGETAGYKIRTKDGSLNTANLKRALNWLLENGNNELICIHFPEGAYAVKRGCSPVFIPAFKVSDDFIKGTVGAGDAFCSGMLYGIHEEWELEESMRFANAMAAICLNHPSTSGGMKSYGETAAFMENTPAEEMLSI